MVWIDQSAAWFGWKMAMADYWTLMYTHIFEWVNGWMNGWVWFLSSYVRTYYWRMELASMHKLEHCALCLLCYWLWVIVCHVIKWAQSCKRVVIPRWRSEKLCNVTFRKWRCHFDCEFKIVSWLELMWKHCRRWNTKWWEAQVFYVQ